MSSKSMRKSFSTRSPSPQVTTSSDRRRSNLSPTRITRVQEKEDLQNLNDRLAAYIDTVRNLEVENNRLSTLIRTTQETTSREVTEVKKVYEKELSDVRNVLDLTAKEKAKLQLAAESFKNEASDLRSKLYKKEKDFENAEKHFKSSDVQNQELQRKLNSVTAENRQLENQLKDAIIEISALNNQLKSMRKKFDDETLSRVDLENRLQSAKEDIAFKESVFKQEISETKHIKETEISNLNRKVSQNYEQKLADSLSDLREQYDEQLRINRNEIESLYETKIADLQKKLDRSNDFSSSVRDELRTLKSRVDSLSSQNTTLETTNISLINRIKDVEKMLEQERSWHTDALKTKDEELRNLRDEMEQQLREYRELLDIKVALDMEIAAYRKLLEGEELRLNISPSSSRGASPDPLRSTALRPMRGTKRRRILTDTEQTSIGVQTSAKATGDIVIAEHDVGGKFVKIHNKGKQEIAVGGWQLVQKSEDTEVTYKFPRSVVIKPNVTVTVWSCTSGSSSSPPRNLLMKHQSWCAAQTLLTTLLNGQGEEAASRKTSRVIEASERYQLEQSY